MKMQVKISPQQAALTGHNAGIHIIDVDTTQELNGEQRRMLACCLAERTRERHEPALANTPASDKHGWSQIDAVGHLDTPDAGGLCAFLDKEIRQEREKAREREEWIERYVQDCLDVVANRKTRESRQNAGNVVVDDKLNTAVAENKDQLAGRVIRLQTARYDHLAPDWPPTGSASGLDEKRRRFWERVDQDEYRAWMDDLEAVNQDRIQAALTKSQDELAARERDAYERENRRQRTLRAVCEGIGESYVESFDAGVLCQRWVIDQLEERLRRIIREATDEKSWFRSQHGEVEDRQIEGVSEVDCVPGDILDVYWAVRDYLPRVVMSDPYVDNVDMSLHRYRVREIDCTDMEQDSPHRSIYAFHLDVDCGGIEFTFVAGFGGEQEEDE